MGVFCSCCSERDSDLERKPLLQENAFPQDITSSSPQGALPGSKAAKNSPGSFPTIKSPSPVNRGSLKDLQELARNLSFGEASVAGEPSANLIREFAIAEDPNLRGLARAKASKANGVAMEDRSIALCPIPTASNAATAQHALFAVFDGHAGSAAAEYAKQNIARVLQQHLTTLNQPSQAVGILRRTFQDLDAEMKPFEYEGCTATVALLFNTTTTTSDTSDDVIVTRSGGGGAGRYLQVANVGDSSAYLIRATGDVVSLTQVHHLSEDYERQRVIQMGITVTPRQTRILGLGVSRALGDHFPKAEKAGLIGEPYVSPLLPLTADARWLLIASDGLWDVMTAGRASQILLTSASAAEGAQALLAAALANNKCTDNVTVIAVMLN